MGEHPLMHMRQVRPDSQFDVGKVKYYVRSVTCTYTTNRQDRQLRWGCFNAHNALYTNHNVSGSQDWIDAFLGLCAMALFAPRFG